MYFDNPCILNSESDFGELPNRLSSNSSGFMEYHGSGKSMTAVKRSLVLDEEELVNDDSRRTAETKAVAALKSHSEAERRRRERINAHLETLRGLVPSKAKMDKATLLSEVVAQVKQLKATAEKATQGLHIPMDSDDVEVEMLENKAVDGPFLLRASICCDYRPELLSELRRSIGDLRARVLKCEISTLGGRVKCVFLLTTSEGGIGDVVAFERTVSSIRAGLCDIVDKVSALAEYDEPLLVFPRKRRRVS